MASCVKCGKELSADELFCGRCGTPVKDEQFSSVSKYEDDFDQSYYEGIRERKLAEYNKYINSIPRGIIMGVAFCVAGYFLWHAGGFWLCCLSVLAWACGIISLYVVIISSGFYKRKKAQMEMMSAHDLYIEKKRNSQIWKDAANGAKVATSVVKILGMFS